jgi:hypothetical protein
MEHQFSVLNDALIKPERSLNFWRGAFCGCDRRIDPVTLENRTERRKKKISAEESILRIERVRRGDANNRIEGISSDPKSDIVFAAYISGDIEVTEIVPRLKILYCVP